MKDIDFKIKKYLNKGDESVDFSNKELIRFNKENLRFFGFLNNNKNVLVFGFDYIDDRSFGFKRVFYYVEGENIENLESNKSNIIINLKDFSNMEGVVVSGLQVKDGSIENRYTSEKHRKNRYSKKLIELAKSRHKGLRHSDIQTELGEISSKNTGLERRKMALK